MTRLFFLLFSCYCLFPLDLFGRSDALREGVVIRDQEIEKYLDEMVAPLRKAAALSPDQVKLYIVSDSDINASAGIGGVLLLNTGLILSCETPEELLGVLAHELGHIAGGHVSRTHGIHEKTGLRAMIAGLVGAAAMIAAGQGEGAIGALALGQDLHLKTMLHYSRGQEGSADQAAKKYLKAAGISARGLITFFERLHRKEYLSSQLQDPYMRTHPSGPDRIALLKHNLEDFPQIPAKFQHSFKRIKLKLASFFEKPDELLRKYKGNNFDAQYIRAIALHRQGKSTQSIELLKTMLRQYNDPALWELYGQFLSERGAWAEAVKAYSQAKSRGMKGHLIDVSHGQALISSQQSSQTQMKEGIQLIKNAIRFEKNPSPFSWRLLAIAYGKLHEMGKMALCLAEEALLYEDHKTAFHQAKKAQGLLVRGTPYWLRADDILVMRREKNT